MLLVLTSTGGVYRFLLRAQGENLYQVLLWKSKNIFVDGICYFQSSILYVGPSPSSGRSHTPLLCPHACKYTYVCLALKGP